MKMHFFVNKFSSLYLTHLWWWTWTSQMATKNTYHQVDSITCTMCYLSIIIFLTVLLVSTHIQRSSQYPLSSLRWLLLEGAGCFFTYIDLVNFYCWLKHQWHAIVNTKLSSKMSNSNTFLVQHITCSKAEAELVVIYPVVNNDILELWNDGFRTRQAFNTHRDKRREGQRGMCMARAHDVTMNQDRRHGNLLKRIPGNHGRGTTGHNRWQPAKGIPLIKISGKHLSRNEVGGMELQVQEWIWGNSNLLQTEM